MNRKSFTVSEAEGMIPALTDVFREVGTHRRAIRELASKLEVLELLWGSGIREDTHPDHPEFQTHREGIDAALRAIQSLVEHRILAYGMRFPVGGIEEGLVDFPTTYEGRWVLLCWKFGERTLDWWHEIDGGFQGRRKLTEHQRAAMGLDDPADIDDSELDF
jgi:hypothetical protein